MGQAESLDRTVPQNVGEYRWVLFIWSYFIWPDHCFGERGLPVSDSWVLGSHLDLDHTYLPTESLLILQVEFGKIFPRSMSLYQTRCLGSILVCCGLFSILFYWRILFYLFSNSGLNTSTTIIITGTVWDQSVLTYTRVIVGSPIQWVLLFT